MSAAMKLSDGIFVLLRHCDAFKYATPGQRFTIDSTDALRLHRTLTLMQGLATNMEIELACLRDMEAAREIERGAEATTTDVMSRLVAEIDGNVIHMDFGRKS